MRRLFCEILITLCCLGVRPVPAQEVTVTLLLTNGEEVKVTVYDVGQGDLYFRVASARQAYTYGETMALAKIDRIRTADGRVMTTDEFLKYWKGDSPEPQAAAAPPVPPPAAPPSSPPEYGPGLRTPAVLARDTLQARGGVGLRLPEIPRLDPTPALQYNDIADLLAECGLAGQLLFEIGSGEFKQRQLTPSQQQMVDAVLQSRAWGARKRDLRAAHLQALVEFQKLYQDASPQLQTLFNLRPAQPALVFLEFVQYLRAENAQLFSDKWEMVEKTFSPGASAALRDLLDNYEDWYYLYGQELEKQGVETKP